MKGEYVETKNQASSNMFSKLHHHHNPNPNHHQPPPHHHHHHHNLQSHPHPHHHQNFPFSHHFQLSRETTEDDHTAAITTATDGGGATPQAQKGITFSDPSSGGAQKGITFSDPSSGGGDVASIEISRRPRGRPPGSKNKPKPPVFITQNPEPVMSPYILEVPGGSDVVEIISRFCRRKNLGLCVLTGSGTVANVTLRQPSTTTPGSTITFHGRFDILSISATFLSHTASYQMPNVFTISLAGPQGQTVGGAVAGALIAAGTVYVVAASFTNPSYHRLPVEEEARNSVSSGGGGEQQSPPGSVGGGSSGGGGGEGGQVAESCMYSTHINPGGSDVIWAPTARPPQQPPPPHY